MEGKGEVDLRVFDEVLRQRGVSLYYPFIDRLAPGRSRTGFRKTISVESLADRGARFFEPPADAPEAQRGEIQAVIVPALAADAAGHRIGYGAGYYDATLPDVCPPARSIVVAYDFQLMAELPHESHDIPCDAVVTDQRQLVTKAQQPPQ
jgi:5-formyltetrahydrofolate cyclo-ligase